MPPNLKHEICHGYKDGRTICGVDEAGRGPLAGPVFATAVIFTREFPKKFHKHIHDSKKMSAEQRENLFTPITEFCQHFIAEASVAEIDAINILQASMLAMRRAVEGLNVALHMALIDGNRCPQLPCPAAAIIGGDDKSLSIAAASILAKVSRDRFMTNLALQHPGYGWERNAGYGTPEHVAALKKLGVTPWHRVSFAPVRELLSTAA